MTAPNTPEPEPDTTPEPESDMPDVVRLEPETDYRPRPHRAWLGVAALCVVLICCGGGLVGINGLNRYFSDDETDAPVVDAARDYLDALADGDYDSAYDQLCGGDQALRDLEDFAQQPALDGYRVEQVTIRYPEGRPAIATVKISLTVTGGTNAVRTLTLITDTDAAWTVCQSAADQPVS